MFNNQPLESFTGYTLEQGSGKLANLCGIFQRKGSSAKRCDKTAWLPYITPTGYLTPGRESKGRRRAVRVNKGVHPSQEQISSGFELLPRLLTHLRPLSFQCVSGESSRTYTVFLTRALCGPFKPSLCVSPNALSLMFGFRWSHPRASQGNNDCISKRSLVCYNV